MRQLYRTDSCIFCSLRREREGGEKEKSGGKSLFSHWQVLCSKAVPLKPVCVIGHRFKEEKEQFVLCWLYKNTPDSMLLASAYSLYPTISMEKNRKTRVISTFLFLYYVFFFDTGNLELKVMDTILACSSLDVSFDQET